MYTAKIENSRGNLFTLTGRENEYQLINIQGLASSQAKINTSDVVGVDGVRFNSAKLNPRNLVISLRINGDVEMNRQRLYDFFITKEKCIFYYKNGAKDVHIHGYIENFECELFTNNEIAQISILCPDPYFKDVEQVVSDFQTQLKYFTFPFSIEYGEPIVISEIVNDGYMILNSKSMSDIGFVLEIVFSVGTIQTLLIGNAENATDFMNINYQFNIGDKLVINTHQGKKSVYIIRNNVKINIFTALLSGSTFFQIHPGKNLLKIADGTVGATGALGDKITAQFIYQNEYRGV